LASYEKNTRGGLTGALLILGGVVMLFIWPFGTIIGLVLLVLGCSIGNGYRCGNCGNKIESKFVKMCPTCSERFEQT
jgi:rubrerythrin